MGGWEGVLVCPGREGHQLLGPSLACIPFCLYRLCSLPTVGSVGLFRMGLWIDHLVTFTASGHRTWGENRRNP